MPNTVNIYVNKTDMGLNSVDNTSDLNKPISNATQTALNGKEDVANKSTNVSLGTSDTLYPSQKAVKTYVDTNMGTFDTISTPQTATLEFRFDKKHIHATTGIGGALASLTGNISLFAGTNRVNVTSIMLHNDSVEPTFSSEFIRSADSLPYVTGQDNIIVATMVNQSPTKIIYKILRGGTNLFGTFLTTDLKGANNGLAELDGSGKVPSSQLPSYVDDVEEYANLAAFPVTGESEKIYVALDTNLTYRWGGSTYVEISPSLALGETSASAYRGDRGKIAYDHSLLTSGNPHNVTKSDVGLSNVPNLDATNPANLVQTASYRLVSDTEKSTWNGKENAITAGTTSQYYRGDKTFQTLDKTAVGLGNCDNTSDVNKPVSSATQTALDNKSDKNIPIDRKTASYIAVANDNGKLIEMNVASANTLTINASLFSAGNQLLVSQYGAGQTTITAGAGVTLRSSGGKLKTSAQYALVTIIAISSTEFYVAGDLTA